MRIVTVPMESTVIGSRLRSRNQFCIRVISSVCALMMRDVSRSTAGDAPCDGAHREIQMAWA